MRVVVRPRVTWRSVELGDGWVRVPPGVELDLGATAKAWAADHAGGSIIDRDARDVPDAEEAVPLCPRMALSVLRAR